MLIDLLKTPANALLKQGVVRSASAAGLCARLEGKRLQILPGAASLAVYFSVSDSQLLMAAGECEAPDATLSGTPLNLARLSGVDPEAVIREGSVSVTGDTEVAEEFRYLLNSVRPDWEEELSRVTGDVIAHEAGRFARGFAAWAGRAGRSINRSMGEYLTEETQALVTQVEIEEFCADVDELNAATDRFEARLQHYRRQASGTRRA